MHTGIPIVDAIIQLAGTAYIVTSALAAVLPRTSLAGRICSRIAADLKPAPAPEQKP
jgi:hypothetical protein